MTTEVRTGQKLYDLSLQITNVTDFGFSMEEVLAGKALPSEGVRLDVAVAGRSTGTLAGNAEAIDYVHVRADGRFELHIHGTITTEDQARIMVSAVGIATPAEDRTLSLLEYVSLLSANPEYAWVNRLAVRAEGTVNPATGELSIQGYIA